MRVEGITISHIQEGKIVQEWELLDTLGLMQQLGAGPTPNA